MTLDEKMEKINDFISVVMDSNDYDFTIDFKKNR